MAAPFGFGSWVMEESGPVAAAAARQSASRSPVFPRQSRYVTDRWRQLPGSGNIDDRRTNKTIAEALAYEFGHDPNLEAHEPLEPLRPGETWNQWKGRLEAEKYAKPEPVNPLGNEAGLPGLDAIIQATLFSQAQDRLGRGLQFNADTADAPGRSTDQFMWGGEHGTPLDPAEYYDRVGFPQAGLLRGGR